MHSLWKCFCTRMQQLNARMTWKQPLRFVCSHLVSELSLEPKQLWPKHQRSGNAQKHQTAHFNVFSLEKVHFYLLIYFWFICREHTITTLRNSNFNPSQFVVKMKPRTSVWGCRVYRNIQQHLEAGYKFEMLPWSPEGMVAFWGQKAPVVHYGNDPKGFNLQKHPSVKTLLHKTGTTHFSFEHFLFFKQHFI